MCGPKRRGPSNRPGLEVADIVRPVAEEFLDSFEYTAWQKKALRDILACRTSALGGHLKVCDRCGHEVPTYNSCRNRHCPKCQSIAQARWIEERKERILPTHYFHLVFTLPAELRPLAKKHPKPVYDLLIKTAARTLLTIAGDQRHLGATPAISVVLHTWTRELHLHPHAHVIISGGGLSPDDRWIPTSRDYLFPVRVLSRLFRNEFLAGVRRLLESGDVIPPETMDAVTTLNRLGKIDWVVYAKPPFGGPGNVYEYLGRYTHRVAISHQRLLHLDEDSVTFRTKGKDTLTLEPEEFVRRFLLHVLPRRFTKIRHYGLLAPSAVKTRLVVARRSIEEAGLAIARPAEETNPLGDLLDEEHPLCPKCRVGRLSIRAPSLPTPNTPLPLRTRHDLVWLLPPPSPFRRGFTAPQGASASSVGFPAFPLENGPVRHPGRRSRSRDVPPQRPSPGPPPLTIRPVST